MAAAGLTLCRAMMMLSAVLISLFVLFRMESSLHTFSEIANAKFTMPASRQDEASRARPRPFALMTEPRCLNATPFVLINALEMLSNDVKVVLLHATENSNCIEQWIYENSILFHANQTGRLLHFVDSHMNLPPNYNIHHHYGSHWLSTMLTNITFWQSMKQFGNVVLTIQADTLICSNHTPDWHANFLGGISAGRPMDKWAVKEINTHHLNGGLSIRNIDWMISCLHDYTGSKNLAEDAVFATCDNGNVTIGQAMAFSSDSGRTMCFDDENGERKCPWGVHKPWTLGIGRGPPIRELVAYCQADIQKLATLLGGYENITGRYCFGSRCV